MSEYMLAVFSLAGAATYCVLNPRVHTGIGGSMSMGAASVAAIAGLDHEPTQWESLMVAGSAALLVWYAYREHKRE